MRWCCFKPGAADKRGRRRVGRSKNARQGGMLSEPGPLAAGLTQEQSARVAAVERLVHTAAFDQSQPVRVGALQCIATMLAYPDYQSTTKEKAAYKVLAEALDIKNLHNDQLKSLRAVFLAVHSSVTQHGLRMLGMPAGDKTEQLLRDLYRAALLQLQHHQATTQTERIDNHIRNHSDHAGSPFTRMQDIESNTPVKTTEEIEQQIERMMIDAPSPLASPHEQVPQYETVPENDDEDGVYEEGVPHDSNHVTNHMYNDMQAVEAAEYDNYNNAGTDSHEPTSQRACGISFDQYEGQQLVSSMHRLATIEELATESGVGNSPAFNAQADSVAYIQQPGFQDHAGLQDDCQNQETTPVEYEDTPAQSNNTNGEGTRLQGTTVLTVDLHESAEQPEEEVEGVAYIEPEPRLHVDGFEYVDGDPRQSYLAPEWEYSFDEKNAGQYIEQNDEQVYENPELDNWMQQEADGDIVQYDQQQNPPLDMHPEAIADEGQVEPNDWVQPQIGDDVDVYADNQQVPSANEVLMRGHEGHTEAQRRESSARQTAVAQLEAEDSKVTAQAAALTSNQSSEAPATKSGGKLRYAQETVKVAEGISSGGEPYRTKAEVATGVRETVDKRMMSRPVKRAKHLSRSITKVSHRAKQALKQSHKSKQPSTSVSPGDAVQRTSGKPSDVDVESESELGWLPLPPSSSDNGSPHDTPIRQSSLSAHSAVASKSVSRRSTAVSNKDLHNAYNPVSNEGTSNLQPHDKLTIPETSKVEGKSSRRVASRKDTLSEDLAPPPQTEYEPVDIDYLELQVQNAVRERIEAEAALRQHLSRMQAVTDDNIMGNVAKQVPNKPTVRSTGGLSERTAKDITQLGVALERQVDTTAGKTAPVHPAGKVLGSQPHSHLYDHASVVTEEVLDKPLPISAPAHPTAVQTMLIITPPSKPNRMSDRHRRRTVIDSEDEDDGVLLPFEKASKAVPQSFSRTMIPPSTIGKIDANQKRNKHLDEQQHDAMEEEDQPLVASNMRVATIVKNLQNAAPAAPSSIPKGESLIKQGQSLQKPAEIVVAEPAGVTLTIAAQKAAPSKLPSYMQPTAAMKARTTIVVDKNIPASNTSSAWGSSLRGDGKKPSSAACSSNPGVRRTTSSVSTPAPKPTTQPPVIRRTSTPPSSRLPKPTPMPTRVQSISYNSRASYKDMTISASLKSEAPVSAAIVSRLFPNARISSDTYSSMRASEDHGRTSVNNSLRASMASINRLATSKTASIAAKYGSRTTKQSLGPDGRWP